MIGKHLFDPESVRVNLTRFFGVSKIGDQQPRLFMVAIPNRHQIDSMPGFPVRRDFDRFPNPRPSTGGQVSSAIPIPKIFPPVPALIRSTKFNLKVFPIQVAKWIE